MKERAYEIAEGGKGQSYKQMPRSPTAFKFTVLPISSLMSIMICMRKWSNLRIAFNVLQIKDSISFLLFYIFIFFFFCDY